MEIARSKINLQNFAYFQVSFFAPDMYFYFRLLLQTFTFNFEMAHAIIKWSNYELFFSWLNYETRFATVSNNVSSKFFQDLVNIDKCPH